MSTPPGAAGRRENIFTHKIGPLPMWAWVVISAAILIGWAYLKNRNTSQAAPTDTANASQVPQFINQTYTTVTPPGAPGTPAATTGQVTVPNVVGMTDTAGDAAIRAVGLKVGDKNEPKGGSGGSRKISSQSPTGGTQVARGSTVTVTLGGGGTEGHVPTRKPRPKKPRPKDG